MAVNLLSGPVLGVHYRLTLAQVCSCQNVLYRSRACSVDLSAEKDKKNQLDKKLVLHVFPRRTNDAKDNNKATLCLCVCDAPDMEIYRTLFSQNPMSVLCSRGGLNSRRNSAPQST